MNLQKVSFSGLLGGLPPEWPLDPAEEIQKTLRLTGEKVVVLDDDPTGTQTVHGVPVLTNWTAEILLKELEGPFRAFYLLPNSRSLPPAGASALNTEIGRALASAAHRSGRRFVVVSRSDSTLRGHFPGEVSALGNALGGNFDAFLLVPFFPEGGRYTLGDVHYVLEGDYLVPAGQTEFARDPVFGYRASNVREWVEEKSGGRIAAGN